MLIYVKHEVEKKTPVRNIPDFILIHITYEVF